MAKAVDGRTRNSDAVEWSSPWAIRIRPVRIGRPAPGLLVLVLVLVLAPAPAPFPGQESLLTELRLRMDQRGDPPLRRQCRRVFLLPFPSLLQKCWMRLYLRLLLLLLLLLPPPLLPPPPLPPPLVAALLHLCRHYSLNHYLNGQ